MAEKTLVAGEKVRVARCEWLGGAQRRLLFVMEDDSEVILDEAAIRRGREVMMAMEMRPGDLVEAALAIQMEHAKTCPDCGPAFKRGPAN